MAKTSMVNRETKRTRLVKKFAARRDALKKIVSSQSANFEEKMEAAVKLQKLAYSKFGLGRNKLREATMRGDVPGLRKASW